MVWFFMLVGEGTIFVRYIDSSPITAIISIMVFIIGVYEVGKRFRIYEDKHKEDKADPKAG